MLHERPSPSISVALQPLRARPPVFDPLWQPAPQVVNVNQQSEQMKRQIDTELRTLSGTKSPHVVPYLHAYVQVCKVLRVLISTNKMCKRLNAPFMQPRQHLQDGNIAIVMEYMDGGPLCGLVRQCGVLREPVLAEVTRQTLQVGTPSLLNPEP